MKGFLRLTVIALFCFLKANAQGVNQLWGMTTEGGTDNAGVIFSLNATAGNFQLRKQLQYIIPGNNPRSMEPVEYNGKFYGMTNSGGGNNNGGVIFEWDPFTNLYTKKVNLGAATGNAPEGSLTLHSGKFYGMTSSGGINNGGVIFEWDPATNVYTKKIDLSAANGYVPFGDLILYGGKFYGMTSAGGLNSAGVIFEWDPATNIYTKKIDLTIAGGRIPHGNLTLDNNKFYGMTRLGGINSQGVIFEWDPATNIYTKKIDLNTTGGYNPIGSLKLVAGKCYGMTNRGGSNDGGVIFEWDPATNVYLKKIDLNCSIGCTPSGNLTLSGSKFYGMTRLGGTNSQGVVFEWDPVTNIYTKKIDLVSASGIYPNGHLTLSNGKFYALTSSGGIVNCGVIFEWDPVTNAYTKKIDLNTNEGLRPHGSFVYSGGKLYSMTAFGSTNTTDNGVIFEWDLATGEYTRKIYLTTTNGYNPYGSLAMLGGKCYGLTYYGGSDGSGVIFEWDPVTNIYTKKTDLTNANGMYPYGDLVLSGGKFYGMTNYGGGNSFYGTIFEWDPVTNIFTRKIDLSNSIGSNPYGSLTLFNDKLYGMTSNGGSNGAGVIFEWDPVTNIYTKKIDLSTTNGSAPRGNLTLRANKFYGMTRLGGTNNQGVIFEWDPVTNIFIKKIDLTIADGGTPYSSLTLNADKFYGMTGTGGANGIGVIFEWDPVTNIYTKKKDFAATDGRYPAFNNLIVVPAPVAKGNLVSCEALPAITIDATNNNVWVPIVDNLGDIAAEINANGNNLGIVSSSLYTKNGTCREDGSNRLYLNRNISISPQTQPGSGNVSVRIYIKKSELDSLRTAMNSMGQPSGVASINEVDVFKNNDACSTIGSLTALPLTATTGTYNSDYYLQVSISSFSSFYFANKLLTAILPVKITSFSGKRTGAVNELKWEASCNSSVLFYVERSKDGIHFDAIGNVSAADCRTPFYFTDNTPFSKNNYYRLRFIETGATLKYSAVILLNTDKANPLQINVQPNLVKGSSIDIELNADKNQSLELHITDVTGRMMLKRQLTVQEGSNREPVNVSTLAPGIYWLYAVAKDGRSNVLRFVKQ